MRYATINWSNKIFEIVYENKRHGEKFSKKKFPNDVISTSKKFNFVFIRLYSLSIDSGMAVTSPITLGFVKKQ